jgi:hypothetical protein
MFGGVKEVAKTVREEKDRQAGFVDKRRQSIFGNILKLVDFLVIDDAFDPRKSTLYKSGYQFGFLDTFLRYRLETLGRAICFTSNVPVEEIAKSWTPSIASLVQRSVPAPMEFTDWLSAFPIKRCLAPNKTVPGTKFKRLEIRGAAGYNRALCRKITIAPTARL